MECVNCEKPEGSYYTVHPVSNSMNGYCPFCNGHGSYSFPERHEWKLAQFFRDIEKEWLRAFREDLVTYSAYSDPLSYPCLFRLVHMDIAQEPAYGIEYIYLDQAKMLIEADK